MRDSIFLILQHRQDSVAQAGIRAKEHVLFIAELLASPVLASAILGVFGFGTLLVWLRYKKWQVGA